MSIVSWCMMHHAHRGHFQIKHKNKHTWPTWTQVKSSWGSIFVLVCIQVTHLNPLESQFYVKKIQILFAFLLVFQVGLFRKSGVKSRIQALRQMCETSPENVNYEDQSAYDVADMVKQFFRDLPEPLLTSKMGETFLHIYQCKSISCLLWAFLHKYSYITFK